MPIDRVAASVLATLLVIGTLACGEGQPKATGGPSSACDLGSERALLEPPSGIYFGVNLDWENDSAAEYSARLGKQPAVYVAFAPFPLDQGASDFVDATVEQVEARRGMLMLTLEPRGGLATVDDQSAAELAGRLAAYNERGVQVFLRFGHEMNGSWYPWSQQPEAYVEAFRLIAEAVHERAESTAMVWAPNYGGGYPFAGGQYEATSGSPGFAGLDTNDDGTLSMADDLYAPYYPGDDAVDWVGMSLYHWGSAYPWGENELPEPGKFIAQLSGTYRGANGDERSLSDFYETYAIEHAKPIAITETAAFFAPDAGGSDGATIKERWWNQVFSSDVHERFSRIGMINWFEWSKHETEVDARVDWAVTRDPATAAAFKASLPGDMRFAGDVATCG